jgi:hypothetical protein
MDSENHLSDSISSQVMFNWLYSIFSVAPTQADIHEQWVARRNLKHHFDFLVETEAMLEDLDRKAEAADYKSFDLMQRARLKRNIGEVSKCHLAVIRNVTH